MFENINIIYFKDKNCMNYKNIILDNFLKDNSKHINTLENFSLNSFMNIKDEPINNICAICLNEFRSLCIPNKCTHIFCYKCLKFCFKTKKICPFAVNLLILLLSVNFIYINLT